MPTLTSPRSTVRSLARLGPWVRPIRGRLAAAGIIVPLAATMRSFRRRSARVYTRRSEALAAVTTRTAETFAGIRAVQALRMQGANDAVFADFNGHHRHLNGAAGLEMARYVTASRLVANIAVATLMLWGAHRVAAGGVELGVFAAVVLNLRRLYDEPLRLGGVVEAYQSASASLRAIAAILTRQPAVDEPTHPAGLPAQPVGQPGRAVLFDQVSFGYDAGLTVLPCLTLAIPAGQTVAVVGATGSGKSTLVKLLARLYDPSGGRIVVDGVDLRDLATDDLHRMVVTMPQEAFLFTATVAENIALGRPGVRRSDIEAAATAVGAHRFITELPDGYDTRLAGGGGRLSGGQRQLLALARVLIAEPSVVLLDEPTSSLDIPTERLIHDAMRTVLAGRTVLIIAHRPATIRIADRILVMSDGQIMDDRSTR